MADNQTAYLALRELASKSLQSAQQLPAQVDVVAQWSGVGFSLFGLNFIVSMGDLNEMLEVPPHTKLPGVEPWVKGVANVRGRLLPVFDLAAYFGGKLYGNKKQQRLLVIDREQVYAGLWVDQVFGMQYFPVDSKTSTLPSTIPDSVVELTDGCFHVEGGMWTVFHPLKLLEQSRFLDVAVN
ncbi:MAG: chemotaxis protein CheW [Pseudomonadota bacterium]